MGIADAWDTRARTEQQFQFMSYIPFAALAAHKACCTSSRRRVEYPKSHFESQKKAEKSTNILQALAENSLLHQSLRVGASVLAVDVVPWLVATLSPNIRRFNPAVQTADEKAMIERLIDLMASLGLSFRPKYLPDGSEDYTLEPYVVFVFSVYCTALKGWKLTCLRIFF
jgi:chromosome transmission fidelity protein 18